MKKSRIACVSFLNALPFVSGLRHPSYRERFQITLDTPAACTDLLVGGAADLALVPVAAIGRHGFPVVSEYCIGADGKVDSVLLLSQRPLKEIQRIFLDYQSQTSVILARILESQRWKTGATFIAGQPGYEKMIGGETGGIVIGDRALKMKSAFRYSYDLAAEWKSMTGLPFVFACWCAVREPDRDTIRVFNDALAEGLTMIDQLTDPALEPDLSKDEQKAYLKHSVSFSLDDRKRAAMKLYLEYAAPILESADTLKA